MPKPSNRTRPKSAKVTIHDVAREAEVSIYGVSRALNGLAGVNPETRERILQVSRKLGFRSRQDVRPTQFALVIPDRDTFPQGGYVTNVTFHLMLASSAQGVGLSLFTDSQLTDLTRRVFDGIFILTWNAEVVDELFRISDTPKLVINRFSLADRFHVVGWDHVAEGRNVGDYLLERGHQRLGMISLNGSFHSTQSRLRGFRAAHEAAGKPLLPEAVEVIENPSQLVSAMSRLFELEVDGLYIPGQERLGIQALHHAQDVFKKKIPTDVSIVTGENPDWSELFSPPLTTVGAPFELLTRHCLDHMLSLVDHRPTEPSEVLIATPIIERNTVLDRRAAPSKARSRRNLTV
jgi:LacI family transcriptional regulator